MQRRNLTRGPWSVVSFFIFPFDLIRNWFAHRKTSTLPEPRPEAPHYDDDTGLGPKILASVSVWVSTVAVCAVVFLLVQAILAVRPAPDPDAAVEFTTTTIDPHDGWVVGGCARVDMAGRPHQTDCGEHYAVVTAFVAIQTDCPEPYDFYIPVTEGVACFENVQEPGEG